MKTFECDEASVYQIIVYLHKIDNKKHYKLPREIQLILSTRELMHFVISSKGCLSYRVDKHIYKTERFLYSK